MRRNWDTVTVTTNITSRLRQQLVARAGDATDLALDARSPAPAGGRRCRPLCPQDNGPAEPEILTGTSTSQCQIREIGLRTLHGRLLTTTGVQAESLARPAGAPSSLFAVGMQHPGDHD